MTWSIFKKDWSHILKNVRRGHWSVIWAGILRYLFRFWPHDGVDVVDEDGIT